jgi:hypothetical protein
MPLNDSQFRKSTFTASFTVFFVPHVGQLEMGFGQCIRVTIRVQLPEQGQRPTPLTPNVWVRPIRTPSTCGSEKC